jgi:3'(2'), 5'-bisphosphate nucleotidase
MLEKELEIVISLARTAGNIILDFYATDFLIEEKIFADNFSEPVTIADRTASKIIVEGLADTFPADGILSEEEFDDQKRLAKSRVWIIDPLDGTKGFVEKTGDFAVQIGLAENGESILGVVFLPLEDILYFAAKEKGAWLVETGDAPKRLQVSDKTEFAEMNLAVSKNHRSPKMNRIVGDFGLKKEIKRGSVGLKVGLIARKICDLYIHLSPRTKHWDTCAPEIILREAGGNLTDIFGEKIIYNTADVHNHNGVLASNTAAHNLTVARLKPLLKEFGRLKIKQKSSESKL